MASINRAGNDLSAHVPSGIYRSHRHYAHNISQQRREHLDQIYCGDREVAKFDEKLSVSPDQVSRFVSLLDQAHFWVSPTDLSHRGFDGAEWIMEGVKDGQYRIVVRWCPDVDRQSDEEVPFADAGHLLFELAGHQHAGGC